jgi:hypothetical protein
MAERSELLTSSCRIDEGNTTNFGNGVIWRKKTKYKKFFKNIVTCRRQKTSKPVPYSKTPDVS